MKTHYRVHKLGIDMARNHERLEKFLNSLKGEVVSIIPNVETFFAFYGARTRSVLVVEKIKA